MRYNRQRFAEEVRNMVALVAVFFLPFAVLLLAVFLLKAVKGKRGSGHNYGHCPA